MLRPSVERFQKNLAALRPRFPELALELEGAEAPLDLLEESANGQSTLVWKGELLHSREHPGAEARARWITFRSEGVDLIVMIGVGLGYDLKEAARAGAADLLIIEPEIPLLKLALMLHDFSGLLEQDRVFLTHTSEELALAFRVWFRLGLEGKIFVGAAHERLFPELVRELVNNFTVDIENSRMCLSVWKNRAREWVGANLINLHRATDYPMAAALEGSGMGLPAIVIGAGPSLAGQLPLLKEVRDRAILLATDASLKPLLRAGVVPDFVFSDEAIDVTDFFNEVDLPDSLSAIFPLKVCPKLFDLPLKRIWLYVESSSPFERALYNLSGFNAVLPHAYSVSTTAFSFAVRLGCDRILMAGQDLSFPGGRTHASGVSRGGPLPTPEKLKNHPHFTTVKGYKGGEVLTWKQFEKTINWFELAARTTARDLTLVNATGDGVWIEGFQHIPLEEAAPRYLGSKLDKSFFRQDVSPMLRGNVLVALRAALKAESARLREIKPLLEAQAERIKRYRDGESVIRKLAGMFGEQALVETLLDDVSDYVSSSFILNYHVMGESLVAEWCVRGCAGGRSVHYEDALKRLEEWVTEAVQGCDVLGPQIEDALSNLEEIRSEHESIRPQPAAL